MERTFHGNYADVKVLQRVAFYCNDQISGVVWQFLVGGALMVGQIDPETELFSGKDVIYIYPDLYTALIGRYDNGTFISGFMCNIQVFFLNTKHKSTKKVPFFYSFPCLQHQKKLRFLFFSGQTSTFLLV